MNQDTTESSIVEKLDGTYLYTDTKGEEHILERTAGPKRVYDYYWVYNFKPLTLIQTATLKGVMGIFILLLSGVLLSAALSTVPLGLLVAFIISAVFALAGIVVLLNVVRADELEALFAANKAAEKAKREMR